MSGSSSVCRCLDVTITDSSAVIYQAIGNHLSVCNRLTVTTPVDEFSRNSVEVQFVSRCRATSVRSVHIGAVTVLLQLRAQWVSIRPFLVPTPVWVKVCNSIPNCWAVVYPENGQMKTVRTLHICSLTRKKFGTGNMLEFSQWLSFMEISTRFIL